jgi:hypothetical protein
MRDVGGIGEWSPLDFSHPQPLMVAVAAFILVWWRRRPAVPPVRGLMLAALLAASLHQQRQEMLLGVLGVLVLAPPLGEALAQMPTATRLSPLFVIPLLLLAALRLAIPLEDPVNNRDPSVAIAHAPLFSKFGGRVLNDYAFGGYLVRAGIAPFIDSRADLYGPAFLDRYSLILDDPAALKAELDRDAIRWTMLKPGEPAARTMDHLPGWRRAYADATAVIHVREGVRPLP